MKMKKKLAAILTSLTIITQASACTESPTQFDTIYGKRDLKDYSLFLENNGIKYSNCTAEADGNIITIKEKVYSKYIVTESTTLSEITQQYSIDDTEIQRFNAIKEIGNYNYERSIVVYQYKISFFTIEELDNNCRYIYHIVQPGETLESIANQYGVTESVIRQNNIIKNDMQYETIKIPKDYYEIKTY